MIEGLDPISQEITRDFRTGPNSTMQIWLKSLFCFDVGVTIHLTTLGIFKTLMCSYFYSKKGLVQNSINIWVNAIIKTSPT